MAAAPTTGRYIDGHNTAVRIIRSMVRGVNEGGAALHSAPPLLLVMFHATNGSYQLLTEPQSFCENLPPPSPVHENITDQLVPKSVSDLALEAQPAAVRCSVPTPRQPYHTTLKLLPGHRCLLDVMGGLSPEPPGVVGLSLLPNAIITNARWRSNSSRPKCSIVETHPTHQIRPMRSIRLNLC
eukprot:scaffold602614_cov18-Prasinocladus_malaysianus.AAC.1